MQETEQVRDGKASLPMAETCSGSRVLQCRLRVQDE